MARPANRSRQTLRVLQALLSAQGQWKHGYELMKPTQTAPGTLYPMLKRLENQGWLEARWETPGNGRPPRHFYRLTPEGRSYASELLERDAARREAAAARLPGTPRTAPNPPRPAPGA